MVTTWPDIEKPHICTKEKNLLPYESLDAYNHVLYVVTRDSFMIRVQRHFAAFRPCRTQSALFAVLDPQSSSAFVKLHLFLWNIKQFLTIFFVNWYSSLLCHLCKSALFYASYAQNMSIESNPSDLLCSGHKWEA